MIDIAAQAGTTVTIANAISLVSSVIRNISGNDISSSINGASLTHEAVGHIASQKLISIIEQEANAGVPVQK
jgi:hypothetical protein